MAKTIQVADQLADASSAFVRAAVRPNANISHHDSLFRAVGTFGSGSYQLQGRLIGTSDIFDLGAPITVTLKSVQVYIPEGYEIRVTGSGGTSNLVDCFVDY